MNQLEQQDNKAKIGNWVAPRLNKFESILALLFILELILRATTNIPVVTIMVLTLITLAVLYFFNSFAISDDENVNSFEIFLNKLSAFSCSTATIGIMYRLLNWPGYSIMLMTGCFTLIFIFFILLYLKATKPASNIFPKRYIIRIFLIAIIGLFLYFAQVDFLIKAKVIKKPIEIEQTK
jgi:hypothetical protein